MNQELVTLLLGRIKAAGAVSRLEARLKEIKDEQNLPQTFKLSGLNTEQLFEATETAIGSKWFSEESLAAMVDEVEEDGGQHIFLFDLAVPGRTALTSARLGAAFPEAPAKPTLAMYAEEPPRTRTFFESRNDALVVKQVFLGSYWERDEERSFDHDDERATFMVRRKRRAVNLLKVQPELRRVEIRVDRVRGRMDNTLALELLKSFLEDLDPVLDIKAHIVPVPVWNALPKMAADRNGIYLNRDDAEDPAARIKFQNRRTRDKGADVRDHHLHKLRGPDFVRESLNPYWIIDGDDRHKVYTNIASVQVPPVGRCGKVYVSATLQPQRLNHVLNRIRHFASEAP